MDRIESLHKAALQGDLAALHRLVQEDPLLLNRIESTSAAAGNPLHTASLRGDVDFAKELLKLRPELAGMRDEGGSYPIHLAAAGGHVGVVREILGRTKSTSSRRVQDKDGRTALHLAAANGQVEVVRELLRVDPELAGVVSNRGETALHMCVRNNQVEAAAEVLAGCKVELVNVKDSEGNTVLHLATAKKQFKARNSHPLYSFLVLV